VGKLAVSNQPNRGMQPQPTPKLTVILTLSGAEGEGPAFPRAATKSSSLEHRSEPSQYAVGKRLCLPFESQVVTRTLHLQQFFTRRN
jgi:hypothetical protein